EAATHKPLATIFLRRCGRGSAWSRMLPGGWNHRVEWGWPAAALGPPYGITDALAFWYNGTVLLTVSRSYLRDGLKRLERRTRLAASRWTMDTYGGPFLQEIRSTTVP